MTTDWRDDPVAMEGWWSNLARTIAVDFDGVLHPYTDGWVGSVPADEPPIDGAHDFLRLLDEQGFRVVVFSTRADHVEGYQGIERWLSMHGLGKYVATITDKKVPAIAYVDDRGVTFRGNWTEVLNAIDRLANGGPHGAAKT